MPTRVRFNGPAERDIEQILRSSLNQFGARAQRRYNSLILAAVRALEQDAPPAGCIARPELGPGIMTYHLRHCRNRPPPTERTAGQPRHLLVLQQEAEDSVAVLRLLHDAMDVARHLPDTPGPEGSTQAGPPTG